ncbi:hypothetical protein [Nocardioides sp. SYSU DS0663]|uniref:hypothetical protein n=1 Tax=Nocardioides sp. SYSU DS0663 TaxID=3416445 RepID=UPI003F4B5875
MTELSDAARPTTSPLRRYWWIPALLAIAAGVSATITSAPEGSVTYGVINTRSVSSLPNDRLDLINDVSTAAALPSVLEEPAEIAGMSVDELREAISIERIGDTTLARVTFTSENEDTEVEREVITAVVGGATEFLARASSSGGGEPSPQLVAAREAEEAASAAVAEAVEENFGIEPTREYAVLQNQTLSANDRTAAERREAARRLRTTSKQARAYEELLLNQQRAETTVTRLEATEVDRVARQADLAAGVPVSFEGDVPSTNDVTARARRILAAAAAGALLGVILVIAIARTRRRDTPA